MKPIPTREPTPTPAPTPTPTPLPTPTPTPTYGQVNTGVFLEQFEELVESKTRELRKNYWESIPLIPLGAETRFRNEFGLIVEGFIRKLDGATMEVQDAEEVRTVDLKKLDAVNRFKYDPEFRADVIDLEARLKAFQELSPSYKIDQLDLTKEQRLELGDPDRLFDYAEHTDPQTAFFLYGFLSREGRMDAKRELAIMYFRGTAVKPHRPTFDTMMQEAADAGDREARRILRNLEDFIERERVRAERMEAEANRRRRNQGVQP